MNRILSVLLCVMPLTFTFCAWAEETAGGITWQGIPWESSVEETAQALISLGLIEDPAQLKYWCDGFLPIFDKNGPMTIFDQDKLDALHPETAPVYVFQPQDFFIAGYRVTDLLFNFAFDGESTKLISVCVFLDCPDGMLTDEMESDLLLKTSLVYSEGTDAHDARTYCDEQTFLLVADGLYTSEPMLMYATGKGYELLLAASRKSASAPQPTAHPSALDLSGL